MSIFQACKTNFGKKVSRDMNTRFKPKVEFTKHRIRSRLSVVRKQWDRKRKGLQVSRSVSQSIPVSLLEKHSQTIAEELADAPKAIELHGVLWQVARCTGAEDFAGGVEGFATGGTGAA